MPEMSRRGVDWGCGEKCSDVWVKVTRTQKRRENPGEERQGSKESEESKDNKERREGKGSRESKRKESKEQLNEVKPEWQVMRESEEPGSSGHQR